MSTHSLPIDQVCLQRMKVLDDNCALCLPNGERIRLNAQTMRLIFEASDLAAASPATVSRCGMIHVPAEVIGWQCACSTCSAFSQFASLVLALPTSNIYQHFHGFVMHACYGPESYPLM